MWAWTPAFLAAALTMGGYEGIQAIRKGTFLTAGFHLMGLTASFSMGWLSDRLGRTPLLVGLVAWFAAIYYGRLQKTSPYANSQNIK